MKLLLTAIALLAGPIQDTKPVQPNWKAQSIYASKRQPIGPRFTFKRTYDEITNETSDLLLLALEGESRFPVMLFSILEPNARVNAKTFKAMTGRKLDHTDEPVYGIQIIYTEPQKTSATIGRSRNTRDYTLIYREPTEDKALSVKPFSLIRDRNLADNIWTIKLTAVLSESELEALAAAGALRLSGPEGNWTNKFDADASDREKADTYRNAIRWYLSSARKEYIPDES